MPRPRGIPAGPPRAVPLAARRRGTFESLITRQASLTSRPEGGVGAGHPIVDVIHLPDFVVGSIIVTLGLLVYLARPREPANLFFAAFMGFVGAGILASIVYIHATLGYLELGRPYGLDSLGSPDAPAAWARLVFIERVFWTIFIFDPVALLYFASIFPRRNALHRPRILVPFALVGLALLAVNVLPPAPAPVPFINQGAPVGPFSGAPWRPILLAYMLSAYALATHALARDLVHGDAGELTRRRARLLLVGMSVAVFARIGLVLEDLVPLYENRHLLWMRPAEAALAIGSALLFFHLVRRDAPPERRADLDWVRRWTLALLGVVVVVWSLILLTLVSDVRGEPYSPTDIFFGTVERMRFSVRWLIFGLVVAYSLLRFQLFDLSTRARRLAAEGLIAGALFAGFAGLAALLTAPSSPLAASPYLMLLSAVVASVVLVKGFDALRSRAGPVWKQTDAEAVRLRKLEVYRAAAEDAYARGRKDGGLDRLQEELGLTDDEASTIRHLVEAPRTGALVPGALVGGRYVIDRRLGRGGGGRVFLANDPLLGRRVVLKEVVETGQPQEVARALGEARLASGLSHPNVVVVFDTLRWGEDYLIVMEHVPGGSLDDLLQREGSVPPERAVHLVRGVLRGLSEVHARGIVHSDVKPANVLLTAEGEPKVADFGVSHLQRATTAALAGLGVARGGTPRYSAPEVLQGAPPTTASDVYSAGVLLLDLLVGVHAAGTLEERLALARARSAPALAAVLDRAVAPRPQDRHADARALLADLERATAAPSPGAGPA